VSELPDKAEIVGALVTDSILAASEAADRSLFVGRVYGGVGKIDSSYTVIGKKQIVDVDAERQTMNLVARGSAAAMIEAQRSVSNQRARK
jgi:hypothetical protein